MQSCLERARQFHEDNVSLEMAASEILEYKDHQGSRVRALKKRGLFVPTDARLDHAARVCADMIADNYRTLYEFYSDKDGSRKEEIRYLGGLSCAMTSHAEQQMEKDVLTNTDAQNIVTLRFYDRLKALKGSFSSAANANLPQTTAQLAEVYDPPKHFQKWALGETMETTDLNDKTRTGDLLQSRSKGASNFFTSNEHGGTIFDMDALYREWCNMPKYRAYKEKSHRIETELRIKRQHAQKLQKLQAAAEDAAAEDNTAPVAVKIEDIDWNAPVVKRRLIYQEIDLVGYLRTFDDFHTIPRFCKYQNKDYHNYVGNLRDYLWSFLSRRNPMKDLSDIEYTMADDFLQRWKSRSIPGWTTPTHEEPFYAIATDMLLSSKAAYDGHLNSKKYIKAGAALAEKDHEEIEALKQKSHEHDQELAWLESQIERLKDILDEPLTSTIEDLQKRQSRTQEDLEADEADFSDESANDDNNEESVSENSDDKAVYNPLNLPLGFDGRPIPYWLYKLHGLGIEFKCEICGNYSYWGRRAFEKHFSEWRHAFGMRCLKIPNTPHFREITSIQDALRLYERLLRESQLNAFNPEDELEVEDDQGNVMSLRDFRARKGESAKF